MPFAQVIDLFTFIVAPDRIRTSGNVIVPTANSLFELARHMEGGIPLIKDMNLGEG